MTPYACITYFTEDKKLVSKRHFVVETIELAQAWKGSYEEAIRLARKLEPPTFTNGDDQELDNYIEWQKLRDMAYSFYRCMIKPVEDYNGNILKALPNEIYI